MKSYLFFLLACGAATYAMERTLSSPRLGTIPHDKYTQAIDRNKILDEESFPVFLSVLANESRLERHASLIIQMRAEKWKGFASPVGLRVNSTSDPKLIKVTYTNHRKEGGEFVASYDEYQNLLSSCASVFGLIKKARNDVTVRGE